MLTDTDIPLASSTTPEPGFESVRLAQSLISCSLDNEAYISEDFTSSTSKAGLLTQLKDAYEAAVTSNEWYDKEEGGGGEGHQEEAEKYAERVEMLKAAIEVVEVRMEE